jgi:histidinol-phosphate phosphatase family protein
VGRRDRGPEPPARPAAILLDRDGTLVVDVPHNGDPSKVEPMPGAREALDRVRAAGVPMAVVSNQSGVGRSLVSMEDVEAVQRRIEELVGPIGPMFVCPHLPAEGCDCRKPMPGLVRRAADALAVPSARCALIGDIGADVDAALASGRARSSSRPASRCPTRSRERPRSRARSTRRSRSSSRDEP